MTKKLLKPIIIILGIVLTLWLLQCILMPKYVSQNEEGILSQEYYDNIGDADVLFVGDCEVYSNFSTVKMWKDYGISSYIRGTPQQLIWHSYYMLKDTLRYETPKVVVFNVLSVKYGEPQSEAYNRLALDGMRWSSVKSDAVKASMTSKESYISYMFPLLRFHSRWSELSGEDFKYMFSREQLSCNGYVMRIDVKPVTDIPQPIPLEDYTISPVCMDYLDRMRVLCEENGIKFVLIKAPTLYPHWYDQWDAQIRGYAQKYKLDYINFLELTDEIGLNYQTDTYDAGMHMNLSGAEKLAGWFGNWLRSNTQVPDHRSEKAYSDRWAEKEAYYNSMRDAQQKQLDETGELKRYR